MTRLLWNAILMLSAVTICNCRIDREIPEGFPTSVICDDGDKDLDIGFGMKATCIITRNSIVVVNKTGMWKDIYMEGVYFDIRKNELFRVELSYGNAPKSEQIWSNMFRLNNDCPTEYRRKEAKRKGGFLEVMTYSKTDFGSLSIEQYSKLSAVCYKDCKEATAYGSKSDNFADQKLLEFLVVNASLKETPGKYHCVMKYGNRTTNLKNSAIQICVSNFKSKSAVPTLSGSQKTLKISPGKDLILSCEAKGADVSDRFYWHKLEKGKWTKVSICNSDDRTHCTEKLLNKASETMFCDPVDDAEVEKQITHLRSELKIRDASYADSGKYRCMLITTAGRPTANFTVTVEDLPGIAGWIIALIVIGVIVFVTIIGYIIYLMFTLQLKYAMKKHFRPAIESEKPVAYLIYCSDIVAENRANNPLKRTSDWLNQKQQLYIDPNSLNSYKEIGGLAVLNAKESIKKSLSLVVFVTKELLKMNEIETVISYLGFDSNVKTSQPVIFICQEEIHRNIMKVYQDKTSTTFKSFMKKQNNSVIVWTEKNKDTFEKSLYVYLPKVAYNQTKLYMDQPQVHHLASCRSSLK